VILGIEMASAWELIKKNKPLAKSILLRAVAERRKYLLQELKRVNERMKAFEEEHGMKLSDFEKDMGDSVKEHETWFEWKSLAELKRAIEDELNELEEAHRRAIEEI